MNNQNIQIRLSIGEAARLFGVSTKTIRQAIKNNEIKYIIARGRYKLNFESLLNWSQESTRRRNQFAKDGLGKYVEKWKIHNKKYSPNIEPILSPHLTNDNNLEVDSHSLQT